MNMTVHRSSGRSKPITSTGGSVDIVGLADFTRACKAAANGAPEAMKQANYDVANKLVVSARAVAAGHSKLANKAAKSLRASRAAGYAAINAGGARYPFFYGAEFGAKQYKQFDSWRGNQWRGWDGGPGYFLHPTIRAKGRAAVDEYMKRLDELTAQAFPE
jgi:3-hydroxy-3-methylglutaryl CoA synthase